MSTQTDYEDVALSPIEKLLKLHNDTTRNCMRVMRLKNSDYANSTDPYANFRSAEMFGLHPATGILLRIMDKIQRINAYIKKGKLAVENEPVEDALDDTINYCILMKGLFADERERLAARLAAEPKEWP